MYLAARVALILLVALAHLAPAQVPTPQVAATTFGPAPQAVDTALRDRVNEFFQFHVTGEFRKALLWVAEDTQDAYFAQAKMKIKSFKLDSVQYLDAAFAKARVTLTVVRDWQMRLQTNEAIIPMITDWKIEDGKWVWYYDLKERWLTPMGPSNVEPPKQNPDGSIELPKSLSAEIVAARANAILQQSAVDKSVVRLDGGKPGSDRVTFTNSAQGSVGISLSGVPEIPGLTVKLERDQVPSGGTAYVTIAYDAEDSTAHAFTLQLVTEPFNQAYSIRVTLGNQAEQ